MKIRKWKMKEILKNSSKDEETKEDLGMYLISRINQIENKIDIIGNMIYDNLIKRKVNKVHKENNIIKSKIKMKEID